jgi:hypothetical protein
MAALSQAVQHLCDGPRCQAGGSGQLAGRQLTLLLQLDQQLELGVAELCVGQVRVASANPVERAKDPPEGEPKLGHLSLARIARCGGRLNRNGEAHRASDSQRLGGRLGVRRRPAHPGSWVLGFEQDDAGNN